MEQKSILITGCSSGIGLASATTLKQRGYHVFATARKLADVEKLQSLGLTSLILDITDPASIQAALHQVLATTGGTLDAVFNNAGYVLAGGLEDLTPEMIQAQFTTNTFGPMELIRQILPTMRKQGHGRIVQNSSILGIVTLRYYGAYNASKFALEGFSNTLRQELRGSGIHVAIINPGPIKTGIRQNAYQVYQNTLKKLPNKVHAATYQTMEKTYFTAERRDDKITLPPDAVVKKLLHALESSYPHAHYYIGLPAQLLVFLRRVLPDCALDYVLSKI